MVNVNYDSDSNLGESNIQQVLNFNIWLKLFGNFNNDFNLSIPIMFDNFKELIIIAFV